MPHALLRQTLGQADRLLLRLYLPVAQVGVYGAGATVANTLSMYREAFRRAWMPLAFERMSDADAPRLFARLATVAFGVLVFATLGLALFAGPLIRWLTPPEYHAAAGIAPLLAAGVAVHALTVFLTTSLNVSKRAGALPWATGAGAFVTVAANLALIPPLRMQAPALGHGPAASALVCGARRLRPAPYPIPYELGAGARIAATGRPVLRLAPRHRTLRVRSSAAGAHPRRPRRCCGRRGPRAALRSAGAAGAGAGRRFDEGPREKRRQSPPPG